MLRFREERRISVVGVDVAALVGVLNDADRCSVREDLLSADETEDGEEEGGVDDPSVLAERGLDSRLAEALCLAEAGVEGDPAGLLAGGCSGTRPSDNGASFVRDRGVANPDIERVWSVDNDLRRSSWSVIRLAPAADSDLRRRSGSTTRSREAADSDFRRSSRSDIDSGRRSRDTVEEGVPEQLIGEGLEVPDSRDGDGPWDRRGVGR